MRRIVVVAFVCLAGPSVAEPCGVVVFKHQSDATERQVDRQPPAQVAGSVVRVVRGRRADTSCSETGLIEINITGAKDDRTPRERIGYRITHVAGMLPDGLYLPSDVLVLSPVADDPSRELFRLALMWGDRATGDQQAIDFSLALTAVDLAGNESAPSSPVPVRHPGGKLER